MSRLLRVVARSLAAALAVPILAAAPARAGEGATVAACPAGNTSPSPAVAYLCDALRVIEARALVIDGIDWAGIKGKALAAAQEASSPDDVHPIIAFVLRELDPHSTFYPPPEAARLAQPSAQRDRMVIDPTTRVAYADLAGFAGTHAPSIEGYVRELRAGLARSERDGACGYIVDLRRNRGGNMWPALLGVQPLLGMGTVGGFLERDGTLRRWRVESERAGIDGRTVVAVPDLPAPVTAATLPVAVLLGPFTGSAGEAVAIAFRGRPATRSFGWHTAGRTTANAGFALRDGAAVYLAIADMVDRAGGRAVPYVEPDERTTSERLTHRTGRMVDETREIATAWLRSTPACRGVESAPAL